MALATVTGTVTYNGAPIGKSGTLYAVPQAEGEWVVAGDHIAHGVAKVGTDPSGDLYAPGLQVEDVPELLYTLRWEAHDNSLDYTIGTFDLSGGGDLTTITETAFTAITETVASNIAAAAALGATNDTATASFVNNPASATATALNSRGVVSAPSGTAAANVTKLNADATTAASFGVSLVVKGTFSIDNYVTLPAGTTLDLRGATITQTASSQNAFRISAPRVRIIGGVLQGKTTDYVNSSTVYNASAVEIQSGGGDVQIDGVTMLGWAGAGVHIEAGAGDVAVRNCKITGAGPTYILNGTYGFSAGIRALGTSGKVDFSHNDISAFAQGVIIATGSSDVRIANNYIHDLPGQHGAYIESSSRVMFVNNIVRNAGGLGGKIQLGSLTDPEAVDAVISNNLFVSCASQGFLLTNTAGAGGAQVRNASFSNNVIDSCGKGFEANNTEGLMVFGNVVKNCGSTAMKLSNMTGAQVMLNRINGGTDQGILLDNMTDGWCSQNRVINVATNNLVGSEFGIHVTGVVAELTIEKNRVTDSLGNMKYGIYVNPTAATAWAASTAVTTGTFRANGTNVYMVTTAGTTAASGGPTGTGTGIADGTAVWAFWAATTVGYDTITVRENYSTGATDYGIRFATATAVREFWSNDVSGTLGRVTGNPTSGRGHRFAETFAAAAPTTGTWAVGDRVWNITPTAAGTLGWVCTTAGTPGTWKTFGTIQA